MEHRRRRRSDTDVAVRFVALPATIGTGRITNISLSGAFMETKCKLRLRAVVYIEDLDSSKQRDAKAAGKRLAATVVRRCSAGVGLEWCEQRSEETVESAPDPAATASTQDAGSAGDTGTSEGQYVYRLEFIDRD